MPDRVSSEDEGGIEGWLAELESHVGPLVVLDTHPVVRVREAFCTISVAAGMTAWLTSRADRGG